MPALLFDAFEQQARRAEDQLHALARMDPLEGRGQLDHRAAQAAGGQHDDLAARRLGLGGTGHRKRRHHQLTPLHFAALGKNSCSPPIL